MVMRSGSNMSAAFAVMSVLALVPAASPDVATCVAAAERLRWEGTLDVGAVRYWVSCGCSVDSTGGISEAVASVSAPGMPALSASCAKAAAASAAGMKRQRDPGAAILPVIFSVGSLTEEVLKSNGYMKVSCDASSAAWWESTNTVQLLEDLPVKIRVCFESCCAGSGCSTGRVSRMAVYSLGEWNNRLNDNAVLRLERVGGEER